MKSLKLICLGWVGCTVFLLNIQTTRALENGIYFSETEPRGAIVRLFRKSGEGRWKSFCGGTFVQRRLVVTVAHCLSYALQNAYHPYTLLEDSPTLKEEFRVYWGQKNIEALPLEHQEEEIVKNSSLIGEVGFFKNVDLAVIVTDSSLPSEFTPVSLYADQTEMPNSESEGWIFGEDESPNPMTSHSYQPAIISYQVYQKFGHPHFFSYFPNLTSRITKGDSGSPLLVEENGKWKFLGALDLMIEKGHEQIYGFHELDGNMLSKPEDRFLRLYRYSVLTKEILDEFVVRVSEEIDRPFEGLESETALSASETTCQNLLSGG